MPRLLVLQLWIVAGLLGGVPASSPAATSATELMCAQPFLLSVNQIGTHSAFFDWTPTGSELQWDLAVLPHGSPPPGLPTVENIGLSEYLFSGLTPGTAYVFYVRADCGAGQVSSWVAYSSYFVTDLENPSACQLELDIPDGGCQDFEIVVDQPGGGQLGQNFYLQAVDLIFRHEWADDLDIQLTAPDGTVVLLSTDNGNGEAHYGNPDAPACDQLTHLINTSEEAACQAFSVVDADAPFIGTFLPEGDLNNFNTGGPVNGVWELRVCDDVPDDVGSLEFVELHFAPMNCPAPRAVEVLQLDSTSVQLDWLPGENCQGTVIEYGTPGFVPGTGATNGVGGMLLFADCPPVILSGLSPETSYEIYVREQCLDSGFSANSCPLSINTPCSPRPATLLTNFNTAMNCEPLCNTNCSLAGPWFNADSDEMDWIVWSGPTPTSMTGPDDDVEGGGKYLYLESSSCSPNHAAVLLSNCMDVVNTTEGSCHFSFNYMMYGGTVKDLKFEASVDGGQNWILLWQATGDQGQYWFLEYIDLGVFEGLTVQFRFVGRKGFGSRGDIALDNLIFYGPQDGGFPPYTFYEDLDQDGFGNSDIPFYSCLNEAPAGYVALDGDCWDLIPEFNPGVEETPCDFFDANCNGFGDEDFLPAPQVTADTVCSGAPGVLEASPEYEGFIVWYDTPVGGMPLDTGDILVIAPVDNPSPAPVVYYYYAEEQTAFGCYSPVRSEVALTILPMPDLDIPTGQFEPECSGTLINLAQLVIQDQNNTNATYSFHTGLPAGSANLISPAVVTPTTSTFYYVLAEAVGGCFVVDSVYIEVEDSPFISISGAGDQCQGSFANLSVSDFGNGVPPLSYLWSTGATTATLETYVAGPVGSSSAYSVTVTGANGCSDADVTTVNAVGTIAGVTLDVEEVSGCGLQDGAIHLSMQGGNLPYEISWSGATMGTLTVASPTATLNNLPQGGYFITVTDGSVDACPFFLPLAVLNGPNADVAIAAVDSVTCYGAANGCIQLDIADPLATIAWNTGATSAELCNLPAGDYSATVSNGACENVIGPIAVAEPDSLIIKVAAVEDAACFGTFTGAITILTVGGTAPYTYQWSNGLSGAAINGLAAGPYHVTVTDYNGCMATAGPIQVAGVPPLVVQAQQQEISCFGSQNGAITLNASGGAPPYAYAWSTGSNLPGLNELGPGSYAVTLTDFNGCLWESTFDLQAPPALQASLLSQIDASCTGLPDGRLEAAGQGGTMPYVYAWSSGDTDSLAENLLTGWYALTLTDANLCTFVLDSLQVGGAPEVLVNAEVIAASCLGGADGALALSPVSGALPLSYEWSTGGSSPFLNGLEAGTYTVTLSDAIGCMNVQTFSVPANQPIQYSSSGIPPNCFGGDNGLVFLTALNGAPPLSYQWNTGAVSHDLEDLSAGSYVCTITDAEGCFLITDTIVLVDPPEIQISLEAIDSISCAGDMNGGIDVTVSGGSAPYLYTWNNDLTEADIQGLGPGDYVLTVEDALNCAINGPVITLPEPAPLVVTSMEIDSPIDCTDNILDSIQLQISGGTLPYSILWSNGDTTNYLTNSGSGEFDVSVTDAAGCAATLIDIKIPNPAPVLELRLDSTVLYPDDCSNLPDAGDLRVLIEGGYPPYQYNWSHGVQNQTQGDTLEVSGLEQGFYNVTVTDDVGCTTVLSGMEILLPDPLNAFIQPGGIVDVLCKYGSTGSIQLSVSGGFPDYSFAWQTILGDTVSLLEDPLNLPAGQYRAVVRDQFGCEVATPYVSVDQPDSLLFVDHSIVDIFCFGEQTGSISAEIAGGTAPYEILWSTGSELVQITNLAAGLYSLTVTDKNDCLFLLDSLEVEGPDAPIMLESTQLGQVSCFDGNDGFIDLTVSGGTPGYSFFWSNGAFSQDLYNLPEGPYDCLIIDEKGCTLQTQIFYIGEPPLLEVTGLNIVPATTGNADGAVSAIVEGGLGPYQLLWSNGDVGATADSLAAGNYTLQVVDANMCSLEVEVIVPLINGLSAVHTAAYGLYPNPASDRVWITGTPLSAEIQLELIDQYGRSTGIKPAADGSFSVERLPVGAYKARVFTDRQLFDLGLLLIIR